MEHTRMEGAGHRKSVPLVRVEGSLPGVTPELLAEAPRFLPAFKTDRTRHAEKALQLGDCLYFYVGHACPDFGDMVFVFDPAVSAGWPGTATPFDTGGLIGYIHADGLPGGALDPKKVEEPAGLSPDEKETLNKYVRAHLIPRLRDWQKAFEAFLAAYYDRAADYVLGKKPDRDDPTGRHHHPRNERRAWTWEIQAHCEHPVLDGLWLLCLPPDRFNELRKAVRGLTDRSLKSRWMAALTNRELVPPLRGLRAKEPHHEAERRIAAWM